MSCSKETAIENLKKSYTPEARKKRDASFAANVSLKNMVYDELKNMLLEGNKGATYYKDFIQKFLNEAKKNPNSRAGQLVASTIFQQEILTLLDEQHNAEMARDRDFQRYRLLKDFFQEQRDVIMETNHQKRIIACCSRRAGKTDLASGAICYAAIVPGSRIIYVNLTFTNAINQIWNITLSRAKECALEIVKSSKPEGTIEFGNGSSLRILGNPNNSEIDKLRGEGKASLVIIDEFFHQKNMGYAVDEVISPLLADRKDSTLLCIGTPPRFAHTYGEKCWNEQGWKKYSWTMFDNPYMPDPEEYIRDLCKTKGITKDAPFIQREYYGRIGVYDTEALVFRGRKTYEVYDASFPITDIAIGLDYGDAAHDALITLVYNRKTKQSFVVKEDMATRLDVSDIIGLAKAHYQYAVELCKANRINPEDHIRLYADTSHEQITRELLLHHNIPAYNSYKIDKEYAIRLLAEELRTGRMKIPVNGVLDKEMEQILYKRDEETDAVLKELDEEMGVHPDAMMALLYASRRMFADMEYDIDFKEKKPDTSNYITTPDGDIVGINITTEDVVGEDGGIVG